MLESALQDDRPWPFRPRLIDGETFSSWFGRLAWANGLSAGELYRIVLPGGRMNRSDLDRFACNDLISNLTQIVSVSADELAGRTLRRWAGRLYEEDDGRNKLLWLPAAGMQQKSKSFGQQACIDCLGEDAIPFMRLGHRLEFVTRCSDHGVLLIDRCSRCGPPIQPLYGATREDSNAICWSCALNFRGLEPEPVDPQARDGELSVIANEVAGNLGRFGPSHPLAYLRVFWVVYRLLATGRFAYPFHEWVTNNLLRSGPPASAIPRIRDPARTPFALLAPAMVELNEGAFEPSLEEVAAAKSALSKNGNVPTRRPVTDLLGCKSKHIGRMAAADGNRCAYGGHRYWKLDGVSPEVRAAAKKAAVHEGYNIGPWID